MLYRVQSFLKHEASGGILLGIAALFALIISNTQLAEAYQQFLVLPFRIELASIGLNKPLILWINDGLMAIFFLLVGLEIKREVLQGELSNRDQITLPILAAVGGMILPAVFYMAVNLNSPENWNGWAIPAATDIAFALGVLTLLGRRVPQGLKIALVAIAIIDDLGAIVIIALFYTENLSLLALGLASIAALGLVVLNRAGVQKISAYILFGIVLWVCVLKSGIHPTLAGVITALCIPMGKADNKQDKSPLMDLEHTLHPWVAYGVLPIFAFANAGVSFAGLGLDMLLQPITLGIILGLVLGKQFGVFGITWLGVKLGVCVLPSGVSWRQYYALSLLCGIGFTMSLFIGGLAFSTPDHLAAVRLGVIVGSLICGVLGFGLLRFSAPR